MNSVWILYLGDTNSRDGEYKTVAVFESREMAEKEAITTLPPSYYGDPNIEFKFETTKDTPDEKCWDILSKYKDEGDEEWCGNCEFIYIHRWNVTSDVSKNIKNAKTKH